MHHPAPDIHLLYFETAHARRPQCTTETGRHMAYAERLCHTLHDQSYIMRPPLTIMSLSHSTSGLFDTVG